MASLYEPLFYQREVAEALGVSPITVYTRAGVLGIGPKRPGYRTPQYSVAEAVLIRDYHTIKKMIAEGKIQPRQSGRVSELKQILDIIPSTTTGIEKTIKLQAPAKAPRTKRIRA